MKKLLTIAFTVTFLYACGGEYTQQDKVSVNKAPPTEQSAMEHASVEKMELESEETATDSKSDSAIKMFQGLAKSMF